VTSIGDRAFEECSGLTSVTIGGGVTSIGYEAFYDTAYYNDESNWENNVLYIGQYLIDAKSDISGDYTIKEGTRVISDDAFYNCSGLTSVTIPNSVIGIGTGAFAGCSGLTSVEIPDGVTSIEEWAFAECSTLSSVTIGNSVTSIGNYAFQYCSSLTSITIPNSVTSIGYEAFRYCSSLKSVYYTGTAEEWSKISIDSSNGYLTSATRYYYSESEPTTDGNWWHYVDGVITVW
jgi:hypothetical protein